MLSTASNSLPTSSGIPTNPSLPTVATLTATPRPGLDARGQKGEREVQGGNWLIGLREELSVVNLLPHRQPPAFQMKAAARRECDGRLADLLMSRRH
jgi:hypothetical protein